MCQQFPILYFRSPYKHLNKSHACWPIQIYIYIIYIWYVCIQVSYIPQRYWLLAAFTLKIGTHQLIPSVHCIMAWSFQPGEAVKVGMHFVRSLRHAGAGHQRPSGHLAFLSRCRSLKRWVFSRLGESKNGPDETDILGNFDKNLMNLLDPLERKAKKSSA